MDIQIRKAHDCKQDQPKEYYLKIHYNQNVKSQRERDSFESSKIKTTNHIQGNLHKTMKGFLCETLQSRSE